MLAHAGRLASAGIRVEHLDAARLRALEPALSHELHGALWCPDELQVTPYLVVFALLKAARARRLRRLELRKPNRVRPSSLRSSTAASGKFRILLKAFGRIWAPESRSPDRLAFPRSACWIPILSATRSCI